MGGGGVRSWGLPPAVARGQRVTEGDPHVAEGAPPQSARRWCGGVPIHRGIAPGARAKDHGRPGTGVV